MLRLGRAYSELPLPVRLLLEDDDAFYGAVSYGWQRFPQSRRIHIELEKRSGFPERFCLLATARRVRSCTEKAACFAG